MEFIKGIIFLTGLVLSAAYDDLSKNKVATQSKTAAGPTDIYRAGNAVDRDVKTCIRTDYIGQNSPDKFVWWKVDLGGVYNIYSVNILFKNYAGYERRQQGRFAGFSLYISNTGVMDSLPPCYKDGPQLPALNFTTNCMTSGRYVTFYNERINGAEYPQGYELTAIVTELCEVIVRGCQTTGVYGNNCEERCPTNCKNNVCHIQKGTCFGCKPGWTGTTCNTKCTIGSYGLDCKQQCSGHCRDNAACNHVTGQCDGGCAAGWRETLCDKVCENGTFGYNCASSCSGNCLNDSPCNRHNGHCDESCKPGYTNALCNEYCPSGFYGYSCKKVCSEHCLNYPVCDHIDGRCSGGCQSGYKGKLCNDSCRIGYYGLNCSNACSSHCVSCKPTDGTCSCSAGWMGPNCSIVCIKSYGQNCQNPCSPLCINQTCDPFNGTCLTSCKDNSYGDKCVAGRREEYLRQVPNSIPEAVGGTLGVCVILILSAAFFLIRRKRICMSGTTDSHYAEVEIRQTEDSAYQQLNATGLGTGNTNHQQNISELEQGNTYEQLNVSELRTDNTNQQQNVSELQQGIAYQQLNESELDQGISYQQLNVSEFESGNTYQQLNVSELGFDNAYQNLSLL